MLPVMSYLLSSALDADCKWIIGGLVFAVVGLAGFIVRMLLHERRQNRERLKDMKDVQGILERMLEKRHTGDR